MSAKNILLLHPGAMGSAIAALLTANQRQVYWLPEGRSDESIARADKAGLRPCRSLEEGLATCDTVLSICPPHAAVAVAASVAQTGFTGCFIDANAVSPGTAAAAASLIGANGAQYVDGGIIGPPPRNGCSARLYLSGAGASEVAALFPSGVLTTTVLDGGDFAASALKMCFAGWNKARTALLINLRALARVHHVDEALLAEWESTEPALMSHFDPRSGGSVMQNSLKAWRWSGEMNEIAATFNAAGLPDGFHSGAADVFSRLDQFKDSALVPSIDALLEAMSKRH